MSERKARALYDITLVTIEELDELYKKNHQPRTKQSRDDLKEIIEDLRKQTNKVTITMTERKARTLFDNTLVKIWALDKLHEEDRSPATKQSANDLEEIIEDLRKRIYS